MTTFPAANYWSNAGRTETEQKAFGEDFLAATKQLAGGAAISTLTLASDQITPTGGIHRIDTQGGAGTDNLAQILQTNLPDGSLLMLAIVTSARVVVLKHAAGGTGQLSLTTGADRTMGQQDSWALFRREGTTWVELPPLFASSDAAALRTYYALAGLSQNTFTGRQDWKQGASIASASTLMLGTDGNSFHVTGTTTITGISVTQAGVLIRLIFDGACQLTHNASQLILIGGRDYKTTAGDVLEFHSEGSGVWRQANGSVSNGANWFVGVADAGASDAYAVTVLPAPSAYVIGMTVVFKANTGNTGAATLALNGLAAKTIKDMAGSDLLDSAIGAGTWHMCVYDGTNFRLLSATQVHVANLSRASASVNVGANVDFAVNRYALASPTNDDVSVGGQAVASIGSGTAGTRSWTSNGQGWTGTYDYLT